MQSQGCITPDNDSSCSDQCYQGMHICINNTFIHSFIHAFFMLQSRFIVCLDINSILFIDSIVPSRSAFVDMTTITDNEVREDQVGNDADITQELASSSRDVVVHVASDTVATF